MPQLPLAQGRGSPNAAQCSRACQRRCVRLVVCCSSKPRHFARPSLYYRGLRDPADVVQHCLRFFRSARVPDLAPFLACPPDEAAAGLGGGGGSSSSSSAAVPLMVVGREQVQEAGPLAPLSAVLDVGARRVLPGHLLRRSRVLSTLRLGGSFQQRVALTACTGEESVFEWWLQQLEGSADYSSSSDDEEGGGSYLQQLHVQGLLLPAAAVEPALEGSSSSSSSGGLIESEGGDEAAGSGRWVVTAVRRDGSCDAPLPTTPHPKAAPEAVVKAQLAALARGDIFGASGFNIWSHAHGSGFGLGIHYELMRDKLRQPPYSLLLGHSEALLGAAALPKQRVQLQEVVVLGGGAAAGQSARFLWRLGMQHNSCWMTTGITHVESF